MTAKEFRTIMTRLGWTQAVLAEKLGVSPRTIRAWRKGTRPIPKTAVIVLRLWEGKNE